MDNKTIIEKKDKAWLITWESNGERIIPNNKKIISIRNSNISSENIKEFIEYYYASIAYSPLEMVEKFKKAKGNFNPYPAKYGSINGVEYTGRITCGHNPYIFARIVSNLKIYGHSQEDVEYEYYNPTKNTLKD